MNIGLIGLGRMGGNLALNILEHGHQLVVYNRSQEKMAPYASEGAQTAGTIQELVEKLTPPRALWIMVTAGAAVDSVIDELAPFLEEDDIIIDGGNSMYKDTMKRAEKIKEQKLQFLDVGTSGGVSGARHGACFMAGGDKKAYILLEPLLMDLSVPNGYGYFGTHGAGHFIKMVHNGIEYGMMQAIGEGFEIVEKSGFDVNMADVARVWSNGSVIRSWLMELTEEAYRNDPQLGEYSGTIGLSGEGEWTVEAAKELDVPAPVIAESVTMRKKSKESPRYQGKVVQALRFGFGGHSQPS